MRFLRWISMLSVLALLCSTAPVSLAEDITVDIEEEGFEEEVEIVEETEALDLSNLVMENEVFMPEANGLDLLEADIYETDGTEPAVAANASSDFEIDEDGVLVRYTGFNKDVVIPDGVKEIGYVAFSDDTTMESVTIPNSVIYIGDDAFSGCTKLKDITIPNSVTKTGSYVLSGCSSLTNVQLSNKLSEISDGFFYGCENIKTINIPDGIKTIGPSSFSTCSNLETIIIPDSVTSIEKYAFFYCGSLESITIPSSVTSIDRTAFDDDDNIIIRSTAGSYAEKFANGMGIPFNAPVVLFDETSTYENEENYYEDIIVYINQTRTIKTLQKPSDLSTTLTWTSSNTKVATVDQNGMVKGINHGTTTITAATSNGKGKAARIKVYVPEPSIIEIGYDNEDQEIAIGTTAKISATVDTPCSDDTNMEFSVVWSASNNTILSITGTKNNTVSVKGLKPGKATLTATTADKGKASITINVYRPDCSGKLKLDTKECISGQSTV